MPLQIARAENESFVILKDGLREDVGDFNHLSELAEFISFGLYETVLESNENPVVVISSMGKQSTGKSYMLNHLAGLTGLRNACLSIIGSKPKLENHSALYNYLLRFLFDF